MKNALEEEEEARVSLEERLESLEESQEEAVAQLIKERDHALAKVKKLKKEKIDFGAVHARLLEKFDNLESAHKALKSDHSTLNESHDQLQTQLKRYNVPSTSSSSFGKEDLARSSQHKGKGVIDEILSRQRTNNSK